MSDADCLISFCIPVHNRTHTLKEILPKLLENVRNSPPVEICILDYNSPDDLTEYLIQFGLDNMTYLEGITLSCKKYLGRDYYHMAHARNLSVLMSSGAYVSILSADIYPVENFVDCLRFAIHLHTPDYMYPVDHPGLVTVKRSEFIKAGGYDERFEFYGPEDKDLNERFERRRLLRQTLPSKSYRILRTPNQEKVTNYRLPLTKKEMGDRMWEIFKENRKVGLLKANPGGWGSWD